MPFAPLRRREWLLGTVLICVTGAVSAQPLSSASITVWKDPSCGCCKDWVAHLQKNGFKVEVHESGNAQARARLGVPESLGSCHTAQIGRYALEGHVPAADIQRLLKLMPAAVGLAVPGMPIGAPGMDSSIYGGKRQHFDVLLVKKDGNTTVFNTYSEIT